MNEKLESFVEYCKANPQLRFWQALLNWANRNENADITHILIATGTNFLTEEPNYEGLEDTYYWD